MAAAAQTAKPPGKGMLVVTLGVLTVLSVIGGGLVGKLIAAKLQAEAAAAAPTPEAAKPHPYAGDTEVRELPPIVTNLGESSETRVRIQVAAVYAKKDVENPALLTGELTGDLVAYLKTLSLSQIQGASGLQALREDLNERAAIRSGGKVREIIIENLVVQ